MTTTEYLTSIAVIFIAMVTPALIVGAIAEYIVNRKNR